MRALITGGTGFIGSHLAEGLIKKGFDVVCLVRDRTNIKYLQGMKVSLLEGDCENLQSLGVIEDNYDYVFHLAGLTKALNAEAFYSANAKATENLIEVVSKKSGRLRRFVYISSLAAVGPSKKGTPLSEDCEPSPVSDYGKSKLKGEQIVYAKKGALPITIIRPPAVYGPRDRDLLVFFKMIKKGVSFCWGQAHYSFIYIDDLINGIILSTLHDGAKGEIFFLSDGNIYSHEQVADAIAHALGKRPIRVRVPEFLMDLIASFAQRTKGAGIINTDKIRELKERQWICYNKKAVDILGFEPQTDIREGAQWTANWYRQQQWI